MAVDGSSPTPKVFGIGFHKTGTTTLNLALRHLGYRVTGPNGTGEPDIARTALTMALGLVEQYDAFQDNPWPVLFRELDQHVPGSKFILTVRDPQRWLASQLEHFGTDQTPMRRWVYGAEAGAPAGNEELYLRRYRAHNRAVREHFADRPDALLELDFSGEVGWEPLCSFLGQPVPTAPFPHANRSGSRRWRRAHPGLARWRWALRRSVDHLHGFGGPR